MNTPQYLIRTFGCKANLYDSQILEAEFLRQGFLPAGSPEAQSASPIVCVVNSCTVTDEADRQSRKLASRLSRDYPGALVVVTGCAAEVDPERLAGTPGVSYVVGNHDKPSLVRSVKEKLEAHQTQSSAENVRSLTNVPYAAFLSHHPMDREWPSMEEETPEGSLPAHAFSKKTRTFLKIQEGCNAFCTYCIIPYGRGPSRSLDPAEVIARVNHLSTEGLSELIFTGTNLGDYGTDLAPEKATDFAGLIERVLRETDVPRIRLSSLDPLEITPKLKELVAREPRICPHFHVSLQSPHSGVLRLMKRKYRTEDVARCLQEIASLRPYSLEGVFVGMDVITGFPGETDEIFQWGLDFLASMPWTRLHVFPYSERTGTPATRLPLSVPKALRSERAARLMELSLRRQTERTQSLLNRLQDDSGVFGDVLLEQEREDGRFGGYTPGYTRVEVLGAGVELKAGMHVSVKPLHLRSDAARGEVWLEGIVEKSMNINNLC